MHALRMPVLLMAAAGLACAHIGSPDVYLDAQAGPYQLFVTVQPPAVIPGIAQIQVRSASPGITDLDATPLGLTGAAAKFAPTADRLQASKDDPQYFTGAVWLMQTGSFQVRISAQGIRGPGVVSVPVPAIAQSTKRMPAGLGAVLLGLMSVLVLGLIAICGAAVREAQLDPGAIPGSKGKLRGRIVMGIVALVLAGLIWYGDKWWSSEAEDYSRYIYKPLEMKATLGTHDVLTLNIKDPGWLLWRKTDDFIPDHDHLMHLYLIREPGLDVVFHLHPEMTAPGVFQLPLPVMPGGRYHLYADVVHQDGFPETMTTTLNLRPIAGRPLTGDDASGTAAPLSPDSAASRSFSLPDGYRMIFEPRDSTFHVRRPELFAFKLVDPQGNAPHDMALYMGMSGHAAFVKSDGAVFAHIHPNGSVAMAAFMMAQPSAMSMAAMPDMAMAMPNTVSFPYGFPSAGRYRIFVQMKHGQTVETGIFDAVAN
jgi:hypothetical protein